MTVLPNNWVTTDLESIAEILDYKRVPINSKERQKRKENKKLSELYPYYGATGQVDYINDYLFDGEYVLLGEDGAPFLDPLKNKAYIVSGKFWVNNHAHILKGYISNKYLCFYLNQYNFIGHVTGTTRLKLNQSSMKNIIIKVAPLNEQNNIVEKIEELFSDLDKATEDLKKSQEQLKIYRQAVLKTAFEGKLTEEWRKKNISRLAEEVLKIKNENIDELFKIPKSWKWLKVLQIGKVETGTTPRKNIKSNYGQDCPFYKPTDLEAGINVRKAREYLSKKGLSKARFLPKNSILITCIGATIGKTGIIRLPGASNQQINAIIPYKFANPDFVYYQVISPYFQEQIISKSSSTTLPILNKSRFKELLIVMATKEEQEQIVQEIESRLSVCDKLEETVQQSLEKIEYLRQSILKKAFEGKLVPQWPDLPAPQPGKYWVYVIKCNNDSNYIGFTSNLRHRWEQHLSGEGAEWTKKHKPQYIMYWEEFDSKADAIIREDKLKTGYGRKWIKREEKQGRLWRAGEPAKKLLERIKQEREKFESNNKKRKKR